jgi:two-component system, NarL family, response regulator NreC
MTARDERELQSNLSDIEKHILRLIALSYSNKEIAAKLKLSVGEVLRTKCEAMRKAGLRGRIDVVRYAFQQGWL